jgi:hypothetical protein
MTIPKTITLNGCTIPVNQVKHLYRDYTRYGEYSSCEMIINIDADLSEQKKETIFCHELIETIKDIYLLEDLKHECIQPLAVAVYEIIKRKQVVFD